MIAQEIKEEEKEEEFSKLLNQYSVNVAEKKILQTTTPHISSAILRHWRLHRDIVDSVQFSDTPKNAPEEIYDMALANHIVFTLVPLDGKVLKEIPENIEKLLQKSGMALSPLQKALESINS